MDKLVSVIIPAYNHEKYIKDTINSVLNQTYKNIELIVEDDCSSDKTAKIIKTIKDKRLKAVFSKKNQGPVRTMNNLLSMCNGDYIAILGSDDIWYPEKIEKQLKCFTSKKIGAVFSMMDIIDENGKICEDESQYEIFNSKNMSRGQRLNLFYKKGNHLCHPTSIISKEALKTIGDYNCAYKQLHDFEYWIRLINKYDVYILNEKLIGYRKLSNGKNLSSATNEHIIMHINEEYSLMVNLFKSVDDKLFVEGFKKDFVNSKSSTKNELICEKFFLLLKLDIAGSNSKFFALNYLLSLNNTNEIIDLLEKKYKYKLSDLYHDNSQIHEIYNTDLLLENIPRLKEYKTIKRNYEKAVQELNNLYNSKSWKITEPLRSIMKRIRK